MGNETSRHDNKPLYVHPRELEPLVDEHIKDAEKVEIIKPPGMYHKVGNTNNFLRREIDHRFEPPNIIDYFETVILKDTDKEKVD